MKKTIVILFVFLALAGAAFAVTVKDPYNLEVKTLYSAPDETSNVIFKVPIEVRLLDVSADANWGKVKIAFNLGPLGYTYVGWVKIPVGEILASRMEKVAKAPAPQPEEQ
ncbi:MAG: hypothetical protein PHG97_01495 [Candidatus Margulisbacteria bacterium]|nr:hypothetical protein [Candidatus Margulisiibacteriota bacterium]